MMDLIGPYKGLIIGFCALAAVLLLNLLIYRQRWKSYPTQAQYLAANPNCHKAGGITCHRCGQKPAQLGVGGRGKIYRCSWCETELFRIDAA